jgi:uncharacterized protein (DUF2236 family)
MATLLLEATTSRSEAPFHAGSPIRRVHSEGVLLAGGGRALLMQLAHPAVAAGVAAHSDFRSDAGARLLKTLRLPLAIAFGTREQAHAAAQAINCAHVGVRGDGYDARDPALLLWVLATLIDTSLRMHALLVRPLQRDEAEAYYADMKRLGALLGLQPRFAPPDLTGFEAYMADMIATLEVSDTARSLAVDIFHPHPALGPAMWFVKQVTAGLQPPRRRDTYGLEWGAGRERCLDLGAAAIRRALHLTPRSLRAPPWFLMP